VISSSTAGGVEVSVTPPVSGVSSSTSMLLRVLNTLQSGSSANGSGAYPSAQKQPVQIGKLGLPPSNSTQTFAPISGIAKKPTWNPA
jgi:hypothetical protein